MSTENNNETTGAYGFGSILQRQIDQNRSFAGFWGGRNPGISPGNVTITRSAAQGLQRFGLGEEGETPEESNGDGISPTDMSTGSDIQQKPTIQRMGDDEESDEGPALKRIQRKEQGGAASSGVGPVPALSTFMSSPTFSFGGSNPTGGAFPIMRKSQPGIIFRAPMGEEEYGDDLKPPDERYSAEGLSSSSGDSGGGPEGLSTSSNDDGAIMRKPLSQSSSPIQRRAGTPFSTIEAMSAFQSQGMSGSSFAGSEPGLGRSEASVSPLSDGGGYSSDSSSSGMTGGDAGVRLNRKAAAPAGATILRTRTISAASAAPFLDAGDIAETFPASESSRTRMNSVMPDSSSRGIVQAKEYSSPASEPGAPPTGYQSVSVVQRADDDAGGGGEGDSEGVSMEESPEAETSMDSDEEFYEQFRKGLDKITPELRDRLGLE